jgi:hypothetical protein
VIPRQHSGHPRGLRDVRSRLPADRASRPADRATRPAIPRQHPGHPRGLRDVRSRLPADRASRPADRATRRAIRRQHPGHPRGLRDVRSRLPADRASRPADRRQSRRYRSLPSCHSNRTPRSAHEPRIDRSRRQRRFRDGLLGDDATTRFGSRDGGPSSCERLAIAKESKHHARHQRLSGRRRCCPDSL